MLIRFKKLLLKTLMFAILMLSLYSLVQRNLLGQVACLAAAVLLVSATRKKS